MGLIAHYRLDGDATDTLGQFDATASNVTWVDGKLGQAASFNGSSSYITDSRISDYLHGRAEASIAFWIKKNAIQYGFIQLSGFANLNGNLYPYDTETKVYLDVFRTDRLGPIYMPKSVLEMHHVVITQAPGVWRLYQDGELVHEAPANETVSTDYSQFEIGRNSTNRYCNGIIDDVRIYDHALSKREVKDLAKGTLSCYRLNGDTLDAKGTGSIDIHSGTFVDSDQGKVADIAGTNAVIPLADAPLSLKGETIQVDLKCNVARQDVPGGGFRYRFIQWGTYYAANSGGFGVISGRVAAYLRGPNGGGWTASATGSMAAEAVYDQGGWITYTVVFREDNTIAAFIGEEKAFDITHGDPYTGLISHGLEFGTSLQAQIKNVRVYRTALTDDQIIASVRTRASLDAQGNFYAAMFNEMNLATGVAKSGIASFDGFSELGITDGLVAYYPLTKDAKDYSGNGYDGVVNGAVPVGGGFDGKGAYLFSRSTTYIDLPDTVGYTSSLTAMAWFKSKGTPGSSYHIIMGGNALEISIHTTGALRTGVVTGARYVSNHGSGLLDGSWHHVGVTYANGVKSSFIDGVKVGELTGIVGDLVQSIANRRLGVFGASTTYYANGEICNVKIFNRALSPEEIAVEYKRTGPTKMTQYNGQTFIQGQFKEVTA